MKNILHKIFKLFWLILMAGLGVCIVLAILIFVGIPVLFVLGLWKTIPPLFSCVWSSFKDAAREIKLKFENFFDDSFWL